MDFDKSENQDDINAMIGHAVSCLLEAGTPVKKDTIVKQLRHFEEQSVDGVRKLYNEAASVVEST